MSPADRRAPALAGSLDELALPDVLQLLDLGRKSGVLRLRADAREGAIVLGDGRVHGAAVRDHAAPAANALPDALLAVALAATAAETERAVLAMLDWSEGTFAFAPALVDGDAPGRGGVARAGGVAVDALLMEAARRADEWARLAAHVPHLDLVPTLASGDAGDAGAAVLALAPADWALLAAVDGRRSLRALAAVLAADPLAVARSAHALVVAGVLALHTPAAGVVASDGSRSSSW